MGYFRFFGSALLTIVVLFLTILQLIGDGVIFLFNFLFDFLISLIKVIFFFTSYVITLPFKLIASLTRIKVAIRFPRIKLRHRPIKVLVKKGKRFRVPVPFFTRAKIFLFGFIFSLIIITIPVVFLFFLRELPNPRILTQRSVAVTTKIYDRKGELLYEIYSDQNRTPVTLDEIPKNLKDATIAIEDGEFYTHQGFSFKGIVRATSKIVFEKETQGGSTITQQLIRSALLSQEVSLERKIKEIILSVWAEKIYTKDQILQMYFNQVPYGGTAWGVEAAAQTYFGKDVKDLDLAESALLAGLPAAPTIYSPFGSHPEMAFERQKEVLRRMVEEGYITDQDRQKAQSEKIVFNKPDIGLNAPHFVMYIRDLLAQKYGLRMVEQGGLRVMTSLDLETQKKAEEIVKNEMPSLTPLQVGNAAALITDPRNGEILAMVGSSDYFDVSRDGNVNVALTPQQPGSSIKVVNYAAALQNGFTAATLINDSPITYKFDNSPSYSPVNYDGNFHGWVTLRNALGNSYNIPAVRVLAKIGVQTMIDQAKKMGVESWTDSNRYGLSLTLGGGEVTMLEMAQVYDTLANNGLHQKLTPILKITDYQGNTLEDNTNLEGNQALSSDVAFIISDILSDNKARSSAFGPTSLLNIPGKWVAVKTGTSNEKRDNWTIGYTPFFVVTVWVGNNDNSPMNPILTSGITGATPIWRKITDYMLEKRGTMAPSIPGSVIKISCRGNDEYFIRGTESGACNPAPTTQPTPKP